MTASPKTAVVVLNFNSAAHTLRCVAAIQAESRTPPAIVVVDNASATADRALLAPLAAQGISLVQSERNLGFAGA